VRKPDPQLKMQLISTVLQQEQDSCRLLHMQVEPCHSRKCVIVITRKELVGMVCGLKKYQQQVHSDQAALTFLMKTSEPIGQQGRWLDLLSEYDITIQHRPGRVHSNSNALSQQLCERNDGMVLTCIRRSPGLALQLQGVQFMPEGSSNTPSGTT